MTAYLINNVYCRVNLALNLLLILQTALWPEVDKHTIICNNILQINYSIGGVIMAGNQDSGRVLAFKMSEKELQQKIDEYKVKTDSGEILMPSWPHFCAYLGYTEVEIQDVINRGEEIKGAYYDRAQMIKKMATWIKGQYASNPNWSGKAQGKAVFLLKQDHGDGVRYSEFDKGQSGPVEVKISFGGNDPRAKKAAK